MSLPQERTYTVENIYALPDGQRAELIDGQIYDMAPPNTMHQTLVVGFTVTITNYIRSRKGDCKVFLAPFAVVVNNESEATLKRFYYYAEKCMVILKAENPAYEDIIFINEELDKFHILGKAVAFQSDVK